MQFHEVQSGLLWYFPFLSNSTESMSQWALGFPDLNNLCKARGTRGCSRRKSRKCGFSFTWLRTAPTMFFKVCQFYFPRPLKLKSTCSSFRCQLNYMLNLSFCITVFNRCTPTLTGENCEPFCLSASCAEPCILIACVLYLSCSY